MARSISATEGFFCTDEEAEAEAGILASRGLRFEPRGGGEFSVLLLLLCWEGRQERIGEFVVGTLIQQMLLNIFMFFHYYKCRLHQFLLSICTNCFLTVFLRQENI